MRQRERIRPPPIALSIVVLVLVAGCVPARFRANPQLQEKVASIKMVAIMPPGVKVHQLALGGDTQLMDVLSIAATQTVAEAVEKELGCRAGVVFKPFRSVSPILNATSPPAQGELRAELEDTQALFEAVSASVLLHTYTGDPDQTFPEKLKNFDYSLGPEVQRLANVVNADSLLFISGVDYVSTGGRKALMALTTTLIFGACFLGGCRYGGSPFVWPEPGKTILTVALVDATTGALLWYNTMGYLSSLTSLDQTTDLVEQLFQDFPMGKRPTRKATEDDWSGLPTRPGPPSESRTPC